MDDVALRNITSVCVYLWGLKGIVQGIFWYQLIWAFCSRFQQETTMFEIFSFHSGATFCGHRLKSQAAEFCQSLGKKLCKTMYCIWQGHLGQRVCPKRKTSPILVGSTTLTNCHVQKRWNRWFTDRPTRNVLENIPSYLKITFVSNRKYVYTGWMYRPSDIFTWNACRHMQRIRWIRSSGVPQVLCGWCRDRSLGDIKIQLMAFCKDFPWLKDLIFWSDVMFRFLSPPWHIWWLTSSVHIWHERTSSYKSFCDDGSIGHSYCS